MNKAFENIFERLDELRETYDEMAFIEMNTNGHTLDFQYAKGKKDVMLDVKEIVQEVAEKYNSGWIPCSERLPEEAFGCLVTVMDCEPSTQTDFENILPYFVGYDGESWNDEDGNEIPFEVIAWQPLPKPFKESD